MSLEDEMRQEYVSLLQKRMGEYEKNAKDEQWSSTLANAWFRGLGIGAVVLGLIASAAIVTDTFPEYAAWLTLLAATMTAANQFWKPLEAKALHDQRRTVYWSQWKRLEESLPRMKSLSVQELATLSQETDAAVLEVIKGGG